MRPTLSLRGQRYRGKDPIARMNQEVAFISARRSTSAASHERKHGFVVVNDDGKPLCQPTSREEALKLRGSAGGRIEER